MSFTSHHQSYKVLFKIFYTLCNVAKKLEVAELPDVASGSRLDVFPIERKLKCKMCWHLLQGLQNAIYSDFFSISFIITRS